MIPNLLSIAGFDSSGGAGLQADLKTFSALGGYGMTILTALPVQNTMGVTSCYSIPLAAITEQLEVIFSDIIPHAIKIGMLFNQDIIKVVANFLEPYAGEIPIVIDPVMMAKSGDALLLPDAIDCLKKELLPLATIITPNIPEAEVLLGTEIANAEAMPGAAEKLLALGCKAVLLKGGHLSSSDAVDYYLDNKGNSITLNAPRTTTKNTHGTGCTLSAAIAACLGHGKTLQESCEIAKKYIQQAIIHGKDWNVGNGAGPVHHFYHLWPCLEKV
jgi:hydroxymethylpyrimidine/phosphomethylpyrimidine kinase